MENRLSLDQEIDIPISLIDPASWNSKTPVHGVYRKGLKSSLDYFGIRDRLKVKPDPIKKGRYICINGNQRVDIISEYLLDQQIRTHFKLADDCPESIFKQTKEDPENKKTIDKLRKSLALFPVPCQVMTKLDSETPLAQSDAKLFTLSFDRNQAKTDEVKQAEVYREIRDEKIASLAEESRKAFESRLKSMVRPELPVIEPRADSVPSDNVQPAFNFAEPGSFVPTESEPWGPNPPAQSNGNSGSAPVVDQFVPLVFSLTRDGYQQITSTILRSKSRVFREHTLMRSLEKLEKVAALSSLDDDIDSIIVETALKLIDVRIKALEEENEKSTATA